MQLLSFAHIPSLSGVYIFKDNKGSILYIGKAKNLQKRVQQYFMPGSVWKQEMVALAETIEYIEVSSELDALTLEENLIKQHLPEYNRLLKYNSNHIYIKFSKEDFPAVTLSRTKYKDRARYVGPKQNSKELRKLLQYLRQIFKYRTSSSTEFQKGILTTDFYLGLDAGWSIISKMKQKNGEEYVKQAQELGFVVEKSYEEYKQEYKRIIDTMQEFFEGNTKSILRYVEQEIIKSSEKEQFERCAQLRDTYHYIDTLSEKQEVVFSHPVTGNVIWIEQVHSYWVVIFVKFFDGKIIDIIRERRAIDEGDIDSLIASCKAEFAVEKNIQYNSTRNGTLLSSLDHKLRKQEQASLTSILDKSLQSYISSTLFEEDNLINQLLIGLKERYGLSKVPFHIECIDISHLNGGRVSGGLSCFKSGMPYPKSYRKYKINTVEQGKSDDYQSLREVVTRRMLHQPYPDLLIIDGGIGQINAVYERLTKIFGEDVLPFDLISIGKGDARKRKGKMKGEKEIVYKLAQTHHHKWSPSLIREEKIDYHFPPDKGDTAKPRGFDIIQFEILYDPLDQLLLKIRDEAHRFSNKYRKEQMKKELL